MGQRIGTLGNALLKKVIGGGGAQVLMIYFPIGGCPRLSILGAGFLTGARRIRPGGHRLPAALLTPSAPGEQRFRPGGRPLEREVSLGKPRHQPPPLVEGR